MSKPRPTSAFPGNVRTRLWEHYDRVWTDAIDRIRAGQIEPDPVLAAGSPDRRRGMTVIARPAAVVRQRVAAFLDELRELEPDQHYYTRSELHLTVLSLFAPTVDAGRFLARTERYVSAVTSALQTAAPLRIEFAGVTAAPDAILVQGFFEDDALNDLRDALRRQLRAGDLAKGVDTRYRLEIAHMTVVRFRAPLRDSERFATALERARRRPFGVTDIRSVRLVKNDWFMSRQSIETVRRWNFRPALGAGANRKSQI